MCLFNELGILNHNMYEEPHITLDHPCDHLNDEASSSSLPRQEPVNAPVSASMSPDTQALHPSQENPVIQMPTHSHEVHAPQLIEEQERELIHLHTHLRSQENRVIQNMAFEFEEPEDEANIHNEIFVEPLDEDDVKKRISEESQEESDQEEWTPEKQKRKRGRPKSNVKRKYTKRHLRSQENRVIQNMASEFEDPEDEADVHNEIFVEPLDEDDVKKRISEESQEESDQEEWTPEKQKRKRGRPKSNVKRKYTKRNRAETSKRDLLK